MKKSQDAITLIGCGIYLRLETYVRMCYDVNMKNQVSRKVKQRGLHGMRKADMILIVACLLAAALLSVFFVVHRESGGEVRILCDGIELKRIDLLSSSQTASSWVDSDMVTGDGYYLVTYRDDVVSVEYFNYKPEPTLPEVTSYNLISVANGIVVVEAADCKDQICVRHKAISSKGESIICLPHRLVVEIVGNPNVAVDDSDSIQAEPLDGVVR